MSSTVSRVDIVSGLYFDSVFLMGVSARAKKLAGVQEAVVALATAANQETILAAGFQSEQLAPARPDDLIVAVAAADADAAEAAADLIQGELHGAQGPAQPTGGASGIPESIRDAAYQHPETNLALVSVPGAFAAREAAAALELGLNVMVFSDNVAAADEVWLKQTAHERGLLVMGPDCGTAIVNGAPLGFANAVRRGVVGVVGASGTGMQVVTSLVHNLGAGISHAIGTGSHDVSAEVGGTTSLDAIAALGRDPGTEVLLYVSKPPAAAVAQRILTSLQDTGKPAVVHFLGGGNGSAASAVSGRHGDGGRHDGVRQAAHLAEAAQFAVQAAGGDATAEWPDPEQLIEQAAAWVAGLAPGRRVVRGLYSGGSLMAEARDVLVGELADADGDGHALLDLGDDEYTRGKPHPMIDPTVRNERLLVEAGDPTVAVVLLDFVLGFGANPDPVGAAADAIAAVRRTSGGPVVIASLVGTREDPQDMAAQHAQLLELGAVVLPTNYHAAQLARAVVEQLREEQC